MDFIVNLFTNDSIAHAILILSLVIALGLSVGNIKIGGINLGIAGVLFVGLIFGNYQLTFDPHIMEFLKEFGLILFVYTIGIQVGPGFFASFKRDGLSLNILAASIVVMGAFLAVIVSKIGHIEMAAAVGMFSGATTNTPSLAATQEILKELSGEVGDATKIAAVGYAVSYPFGIIGIILVMIFLKKVFRIDVKKEADVYLKKIQEGTPSLAAMNLEVTNKNLEGLLMRNIPMLSDSGIVISRLLHQGTLKIAQPDTLLSVGDILLAVGPKDKLKEFKIAVGQESPIDLRVIESDITNSRILITRKEVLGKSLKELDLRSRYSVTATRLMRAEIEFPASVDITLQFGDTLLVVGEKEAIAKVASLLGNSPKELDQPRIIPIFIGIMAGVILGSCPIYLPGLSVPVKLGLAGGPLLVAILLSCLGRLGPFIWYMPAASNLLFREIGICLFLACVGLKSGDQFIQAFFGGQGFAWMGWAACITVVPLLVVGLIARLVYKLNFMSLCGLLSGGMTDPPALAFANAMTSANAVSVSYATVYPLVMVLRIVSAQFLVLLLS